MQRWYVQSLEYGSDWLSTQISIIKFFNSTQVKDFRARVKLVEHFRKDEWWKACGWSAAQFDELIKPIISCYQVGVDGRDRKISLIKAISRNWNPEIAQAISSKLVANAPEDAEFTPWRTEPVLLSFSPMFYVYMEPYGLWQTYPCSLNKCPAWSPSIFFLPFLRLIPHNLLYGLWASPTES